MDDLIPYSASRARQNFYNLLRKAARGSVFEIKLRGFNPVVLVSKEEIDGLLETLDIMSSPEEVKAIEAGKKEKGGIPLEKLLKEFEDEDNAGYSKKTGTKRIKRVASAGKKQNYQEV